jgi:hypothetical protein
MNILIKKHMSVNLVMSMMFWMWAKKLTTMS